MKKGNSRGVCTISAISNGPRQDWLACPYRALDDDLLADIVRRLYQVSAGEHLLIWPALALANEPGRSQILGAVSAAERVFVYFQDIFGGEIRLRGTTASPDLSFDFTVVELLPSDSVLPLELPEPAVRTGRYGVIELQTMDFHGSYSHAVKALNNGLDLHGGRFHEMLAENPEWASREIEGPNIANVFKRTFYQIIFKFQVTNRATSAGCALALPQPVWDSWQPFLGAPELHRHSDGTWRLLDDQESQPTNWIYIFDVDSERRTDGLPAPIHVSLVIGTDARTLSRGAFDIAPAKAVEQGGEADTVAVSIRQKLGEYLSGL